MSSSSETNNSIDFTPDPAITSTILGALHRLSSLDPPKISKISVIHIPGACRFEIGNGDIKFIFEAFQDLLRESDSRHLDEDLLRARDCISRDEPLVLCFVGPQVWMEDGSVLVFRRASNSEESGDILMVMVFGDSVYDEWTFGAKHVREFLVHNLHSKDQTSIEEVISQTTTASDDTPSAHPFLSTIAHRAQHPDIIFIFQPGFWGYESWEPSVKRMLIYHVPVVSTGYNLLECEDDEDQLVTFGVGHWIWESEESPWKSARVRQSSMEDGPNLQENHSWQCWMEKGTESR